MNFKLLKTKMTAKQINKEHHKKRSSLTMTKKLAYAMQKVISNEARFKYCKYKYGIKMISIKFLDEKYGFHLPVKFKKYFLPLI